MHHPLDWLGEALLDLDRRGLRRDIGQIRHGAQSGSQIDLASQKLVNFGSNNYLGLAGHPALAQAAAAAMQSNGFGAGASPLVTGRDDRHLALEQDIAQFEGTEAALVFTTGFAANVGAITALVGPEDAVFSDARNHASIIDGCRLSGAAIRIYRHKDMAHLAELLAELPALRRKLVVTDTLFSMDGDLAPLAEIAALAEEHGAMLLVDEAHATGIFGEHARGVAEHLGAERGVHVRIGTLSKALGASGGFVAGSAALISWLYNRARPYVFSTALPPAVAAAARCGLSLARDQGGKKLLETAAGLRTRLELIGLDVGQSESQIIPVILGDAARTMSAAARLREAGLFVPGIRPPSVPAGHSLLRISLTTEHTSEHLDQLIAALRAACG
jgi:8-amino-7-oxononanoate synthase